MVAVPSETAVMVALLRPPETVATLSSEEVHSKVYRLASPGFVVTLTVVELPTIRSTVD